MLPDLPFQTLSLLLAVAAFAPELVSFSQPCYANSVTSKSRDVGGHTNTRGKGQPIGQPLIVHSVKAA